MGRGTAWQSVAFWQSASDLGRNIMEQWASTMLSVGSVALYRPARPWPLLSLSLIPQGNEAARAERLDRALHRLMALSDSDTESDTEQD